MRRSHWICLQMQALGLLASAREQTLWTEFCEIILLRQAHTMPESCAGMPGRIGSLGCILGIS